MSSRSQEVIYLKDYKKPEFSISQTHLFFDIFDDHTLVTNQMSLSKEDSATKDLQLDGVDLELISLKINGENADDSHFEQNETGLLLKNVSDQIDIEITTKIFPKSNKSYEGLYFSKNTLVTQNEAQGFRKITYFLDRPDVMTTFKTTITANKEQYPMLLSNGNLVHSEDLDDGRHLARWEDPFKKPCYLYALVAGDLGLVQDDFTTCSGRKVDLRIYCEKGVESRCLHAMEALKLSMKWDEEKFGREYDLDIYMIVAVDDFNAGAMENKGLNIFNSVYVLADEKTATDTDYDNILAVIGHEYFHNWTGNRITLRDWFQLSLKEGLTVFRDQEFSSDHGSRAVKRIDDVIVLRDRQFAEDAGPTAHPVRPSSVISVDNFFTVTIYEKGSELIRMMQTLLSPEGFRKGMDLYFERNDEQAVTINDFVAAMEDANNYDLSEFKAWYDQAGTPVVQVKGEYDSNNKTYQLHFEQSCPDTPGQKASEKKPFPIPIKMALLDSNGGELGLESPDLAGQTTSSAGTRTETVYTLKKQKETVTFNNVSEKPTPSLLREFSAPIKIETDLSSDNLAFLATYDKDAFNQWESGQKLLIDSLLSSIENKNTDVPEVIHQVFSSVLANTSIDPAFKARLLSLPSESYISQFTPIMDVDAIHKSRSDYKKSIALKNTNLIYELYQANQSEKYEFNSHEMGKRALKNQLLSFLNTTGNEDFKKLALEQLKSTDNMTDELAALACLSHSDDSFRKEAIQHFYDKWNKESLVMNKLLRIIGSSSINRALEEVKTYMKDPIFDADNPNKVYNLVMGFARDNATQFHKVDGSGYQFLKEQTLFFDQKNPHVAAYLAKSFNTWRKLSPQRQEMVRSHLEEIKTHKGLSGNTFEIISKNLES